MKINTKDFLTELRRINSVDLPKAFLRWYIETKFGKKISPMITDGARDGGIDAVVEIDNSLYVLQSKFNEALFNNNKPIPLPISCYSEFDKLPEFFKNEAGFDEYLKSVRSDLHPIYKKIFDAVEHKRDVIWLLITLYARSKVGERRLCRVDPENIQYYPKILGYFDLSLEGGTPLPLKPLQLKWTESFTVDDHEKGITTYVLQARAKDFIDYVDEDREFRILARNVRTDLKSRINQDIKDTFTHFPDEFWYSHNGIVIVCDSAAMSGKVIRIKEPSIINGAQTVHALKDIRKRHPNAYVLVRVIVIPSEKKEQKDLINEIIFRTNQQNKMFTYELRANDRIQVQIAKEFLEKGIFYERKKKEWETNKWRFTDQNFQHLPSTKLSQILMACKEKWNSESGVAVARKNIEYLFEKEVYKDLFDVPFSEIYFKYKLYRFINEVLLYKRRSLERKQKNATLLTCLAILWVAIERSKYLNIWFNKLQQMPTKMEIKNRETTSLQKVAIKVFDLCWRFWGAQQKKNRDLNIHDFFKSSSWNTKMISANSKKFDRQIENAIYKIMH